MDDDWLEAVPISSSYHACHFIRRPIQNDTWTHIAVTWEHTSRTLAMFIDAALIKTFRAPSSLRPQEENRYSLGWKLKAPDRWFHGLLRDLQFFRKTLSETEIRLVKGTCLVIPLGKTTSRETTSGENPPVGNSPMFKKNLKETILRGIIPGELYLIKVLLGSRISI